MGWPQDLLLGGQHAATCEIAILPNSHNMEKETCSSDLNKISQTCHQVKSTATTEALLTFDLRKKQPF